MQESVALQQDHEERDALYPLQVKNPLARLICKFTFFKFLVILDKADSGNEQAEPQISDYNTEGCL